MTLSESIIEQDRPVRILSGLFENHTIPHALLFTGLTGVGKSATATSFAMTCNCTGTAAVKHPDQPAGPSGLAYCGTCPSCRKILAGNHPDILRVKPATRHIKIDQIRSLIENLAMKPYEAQLRVVIIAEAQSLNPSAGNALLKVLEEPPDRTLLILTAPQPEDMLPTIVSRCQIVRFNPMPRASIAAALSQDHGLSSENAQVLAAMANGSLNRAVDLHRSGWQRHRDWLLTASGLGNAEMMSSRPIGLLLAFAERLAARRNMVPISLETMLSWLRDLLVCRHDQLRVINSDLIDKLAKVSQKIPEAAALKMMEIIMTTQKDIEANANLRLALEVMMLRLVRAQTEPS